MAALRGDRGADTALYIHKPGGYFLIPAIMHFIRHLMEHCGVVILTYLECVATFSPDIFGSCQLRLYLAPEDHFGPLWASLSHPVCV